MECGVDLVAAVVVPVDVAPDAAARQQLEAVFSRQQAHLVDLRHAGPEDMDRARHEVGLVVTAEGAVEVAVDLDQIQVAGGCAFGLAAGAAAAGVDAPDEVVELARRHQARPARAVGARSAGSAPISMMPMPTWVSSTVSALAGRIAIQRLSGPAVAANSACSASGGSAKSKTQSTWWRDLDLDLDLALVVAVDLDQDFDAQHTRLGRERADGIEGLGHHDAAGAGLLDVPLSASSCRMPCR